MARTFSGRKVLILISLAFCSLVSASPLFFGSSGTASSITVDANWGSATCSGATCTVTSATRTISGSGTLKMTFTQSYTCQYSKNGGAFTSFSSGGTLAVSNGDTIAFKILSIATCDGDTIIVTDNSSGGAVGSFDGENVSGC